MKFFIQLPLLESNWICNKTSKASSEESHIPKLRKSIPLDGQFIKMILQLSTSAMTEARDLLLLVNVVLSQLSMFGILTPCRVSVDSILATNARE
jgi:hypothetical protein